MKKILALVMGSVLLGLGVGVGMAYIETRPPVTPGSHRPVPSAEVPARGVPTLEIAETVFDFQTMVQGESLRHDFQLANTGQVPLVVRLESSTCQCTGVKMGGQPVEVGQSISVPPGEQAKITLEWVAKTSTGPFRHGARFSTNDPLQSSLRLAVDGHVLQPAEMLPAGLMFGTVQAGETAEAQLYLMSYVDQELEILEWEVSPDEVNAQLDVQIAAAQQSELPDPEANQGLKVTASYRSGAVLGPLRGWLTLRTNLPQAEEFIAPIAGRVIGPISLYGPGWDAQRGLLRIGPVAADEGKVVRLNMAVRGEHAETTEFSIDRIDPPELQVRLGAGRKMGPALFHVPLDVEIPPHTRPLVRMGEPTSSDALILLGTNHPQVQRVKMRVHFLVGR